MVVNSPERLLAAMGRAGGILWVQTWTPRTRRCLPASQEQRFVNALILPGRGCLGSLARRGHKDLSAPM